MIKKLLLLLGLSFAWAISPSAALANSTLPTDQWDFYVYADQVNPGTTTSFNFEIKNTTTHNWDDISASVPNLTDHFNLTGVTAIMPDGSTPSHIVFTSGHFDVGGAGGTSVALKPGDTIQIFATVNVGCVVFSGSCTTDSTKTQSADWGVHYYQFTSGGGLTSADATGNTTLVVTNSAHPMQKPLSWGLKNAYSDGLNKSGISDPIAIAGLFPPGPLDSLLILPITLANQVLSAASGTIVAPSFVFMGKTVSFPPASGIYSNLGTVVNGLLSTGTAFFLLLPWLKSVYGRLQRATSLESHADDTWGVL